MSDLIDRCDVLGVISCFFEDSFIEDADVHCAELEREINRIPAAPRWVRCEDKLPKYTGRYIVWCGVNWHGEGMNGDVMIARYDRNKQRWYVEADNSLNGPLCGDVRYWMPIEPPQEV